MLSNYKLGNLISIDIEFPAILCHFVFVFVFFCVESSWIRNRNFQYSTKTNQYRMNKVFSTLKFVFYFCFTFFLYLSGYGTILNLHFKSLEPKNNSSAIIGALKTDSSCFLFSFQIFIEWPEQPFTSKWKDKFIWFCNQPIRNEWKIKPQPNNRYLCFASEFIHRN